MALRYRIDSSCEDRRPKASLIPPCFMLDAAEVTHNKLKDANITAREILQNPVVDVHAAVGAGKSTIIPRRLAAASETTVLMVVPNQLLAVQLYDYVTAEPRFRDDGIPSYLCESVTQDIPSQGVVYVGASALVAQIATKGHGILHDKILFLDEAHESDAYTFVLKNLAVQLGARHLVRASATFSLDKVMSPREPCAEVVEGKFQPESVADWDLRDSNKPWYYRQSGHTLVFCDVESDSQILSDKYRAVGYKVHRLTSKTCKEDFRAAMTDLQGRAAVLLLADYSFRSGFTFNVTNVIDIGRVCYMSGKARENLKLSRDMYEFESIQAKGRVGRIPGLTAKYSRPAIELEKTRTELEGVEAEAAAYLYRILGYKPSLELVDRVMAEAFLSPSISFVDAMNGDEPLTCLLDKHSDQPKPPTIEHEAATMNTESDRIENERRIASGVDPPFISTSWETLVSSYVMEQEGKLEDGRLYVARYISPGLETTKCSSFPKGYDSIIEFSERRINQRNLWNQVSEEERTYAISVLLKKYNSSILESSAIRQALATALEVVKPDPSKCHVRAVVSQAADTVRDIDINRRYIFKVLTRFISYSGELVAVEKFGAVYDARVKFHREVFEATLGSIGVFDVSQYLVDYDQSDLASISSGSSDPNIGATPISSLATIQYRVSYSDPDYTKNRYVKGTPKSAIKEYEARRKRFINQSYISH